MARAPRTCASRSSRRWPTTTTCSGSPTGRAARWACPRPRSPTSRSAAPTRSAASASAVAEGPPPPDLLRRRLLFVTGKGGVGKTTISAALALLAARAGRRTLVCEVDAKGSLAAAYETGPLTFTPRAVADGLQAMAMNTEDSLREYLALQLRIPLLARIGPLARSLDFVATAAPGVKEILTVGKIAWEVRERHYDLVVVDASATGHVVGQLAAPEAINELVHVGRIRDQTRWMLDLLSDPAI